MSVGFYISFMHSNLIMMQNMINLNKTKILILKFKLQTGLRFYNVIHVFLRCSRPGFEEVFFYSKQNCVWQ